MTNFPSCFTTEGLNVPADSKVSPWGEMMGSAETRVQAPKDGEKETAAATAMPIDAAKAKVLAWRIAERGIRFFIRLPSLTNLGEQRIRSELRSIPYPSNSASSRMKDCFWTSSGPVAALPSAVRRARRPLAAGIVILAERVPDVGL